MRTGTRPRAAAGQYNKLVTLRTMTRAKDGGGGYTEKPVDAGPFPASITPLDGAERTQAMQTGMVRPFEIEMRYQAGMTSVKLAIYEGRTFDVRSVVDPEERHVVLVLLAEEVFP